MAAGQITVDLLLKTGSFETDTKRAAANLKKLEQQAVAIGKSMGLAFVAAGAAVLAFAKSQINALDTLNDVADATGATVENLSALERVAKLNGQTIDDVSGVLIKFNNSLKEADGKNGVSQALQRIGLDVEALKRLDPAEALRQTAVALSQFADDGDKARLVQELFGKSVREAGPFLKDLAEQGKLNATVTTEQAKEAEKFNKELFLLKTNAEEAGRALSIDAVTGMNKFIASMRSGEFNIISFHKNLLKTAATALSFGLYKYDDRDLNYSNEGRGKDVEPDYSNEGRNRRSVGSLGGKPPKVTKAKVDKTDEFTAHVKAYNDALKEQSDALIAAVQASEAFYRQQEEAVRVAQDEEKEAKQALATFGFTRDEVEAVEIAKIRAAAAALEHKAVLREERDELDPIAKLYREQAAALRETAKARGDLSAKEQFLANDPTAGAQQAVKDYLTNIKKAGDATRDVVERSLQSLEDITVDALQGGNIKNAAKSLVNQIIAEFYRLQVVRPLLNSIFGGSTLSSLAGLFGGGSTGSTVSPQLVGEFASGTPYVPKTGLALVHEGERVVPKAQNTAGGLGGEQHVTIINNTGAPVREERSQQGGRQLTRVIIGELVRDSQRGGPMRQATREAVGPRPRRG